MGRAGQGVGKVLGLIKAIWRLSQSSCGLYVPDPLPELTLQTLGYSQLTSENRVRKEDPTWVLPEPGLGRATHLINSISFCGR